MPVSMDQSHKAVEWFRLCQAATAAYLRQLATINAAFLHHADAEFRSAGGAAPEAGPAPKEPPRKRRAAAKSARPAAKTAKTPAQPGPAGKPRRTPAAKPPRRRRQA